MQPNKTKYNTFTVLTLIFLIFITVSRLLSMIFFFDFDSFFYSSDAIVYAVYISYIVCGCILFFLGKKIKHDTKKSTSKVFSEIILALTAVIFVVFTIIGIVNSIAYFNDIFVPKTLLIKNITNIVYPTFAGLSVVYFILKLFLKDTKRNYLSLLALAPVLFLAFLLVDRFSTISASAASLSHFPNIISLLFLAFYMLSEGKALIPSEKTDTSIKTSISALAVLTLSFSAIPDLVFLLTGVNALNLEEIFFLLLKLVYVVLIFKNIFVSSQE